MFYELLTCILYMPMLNVVRKKMSVMTSINSLLTLSLLTICITVAWGQPVEVSIIDFYGPVTNEAALRKCLPLHEGDSLHFLTESDDSGYQKLKKETIDCLLGQPMIKQADIAFI